MPTDLAARKCVACEKRAAPLNTMEANILLSQLDGWTLSSDAKKIIKEFRFGNFAAAMIFANAVSRVAEREGHHPYMCVLWGKTIIELSTHAIGGLSENDFILAAKIDELTLQSF